MNEQNTTPGLDLEAFLNQAKRSERTVTLYARYDIKADIEVLEAQLRTLPPAPVDDDAYGDDDSPASLIRSKIDDLYAQIYASRMDFRVSTLIDIEIEDIEAKVREDLKEEANAAAKAAITDARAQCRRAEISAVNDVNQIIRNAATVAAQEVITREVNVRKIAAAVAFPVMTPDKVRALYKAVGDAQIGLINAAYTRASNEEPKVAVPKSLKPSQNNDGLTSS